MTGDALFVSFVTLLALGLLIAGKASLDLVGLSLLVVLVCSGIVELDQALSGFGNHAVITLAGLYVIGEGLAHTGALNFVAHNMLRSSKGSERRLTLTLCAITALISGIASNTAVMLVFLPLAVEISRSLGTPVSRLLLPMAFSSILGGTLTLMGSMTNLLTSGAGEAFGAAGFGFFEMTPIALVLCVVGIPLVYFLSRRLLPERHSLTATLAATPMREFVTELRVGPESPLIGQRYGTSLSADEARPLFLVRDEDIHWPPFGDFEARRDDTVLLSGRFNQLIALQRELGLEFLGDTRFDPRSMKLFELAISPSSQLLGVRFGDLHLWRDFGVLPVAILRGGHHYHDLASNLALRTGDVLLVCGPEESEGHIERSQDFYRLHDTVQPPHLPEVARRALVITCAVLLLFLLGTLPGLGPFLPIPLVVLAGAAAMVASRCINTRRAYRCIGWPILTFVVGALALGEAMSETGLSATIAEGIVGGMSRFGVAGTLSGLLLAGTLLNQVVSPYAVSVLLVPIAMSTAASMGVSDPSPFLLAVAFAGSNAFATPLGHQVNLLVMGPGGYRYSDFLRVGIPMCIVYWLLASIGLALYV